MYLKEDEKVQGWVTITTTLKNFFLVRCIPCSFINLVLARPVRRSSVGSAVQFE